jgi:hypothetical protein
MSLVMRNNVVACLPFKTEQVNVVPSKRLATITQKLELVKLVVLFGTDLTSVKSISDWLVPKTEVYVRSFCVNSVWAKERYSVKDGDRTEFILVPVSEIVAVDSKFVNEDPSFKKSMVS